MKNTFSLIAAFKKADAAFQVLVLLVMLLILLWFNWLPFGLYIIAAAQSLSCIAWSLFFTGKAPATQAGRTIRLIFLVILAELALVYCIGSAFFLFASMVLLFLGPVLGIAYFIITIREMVYYRDARKPYYML